jgi:hypothetical protein
MQPDESCIVYTPPQLANALVSAIMPRRRDPIQRWLEPCVGKGALLQSLADNGVLSKQIIGVDLARKSEDTDVLARVRRGIDFLAWSKRTLLRFDRIVANPPYLAIRALKGELLTNALTTMVPCDGTFVPHRANCWYAFLCASVGLLRRGGGLAFVLPAAWEYADYAEPMRRGIDSLFEAVSVYRSVSPLFSGVQEGAVVLVARGYGDAKGRQTSRLAYQRTSYMLRAITQGRQGTTATAAVHIVDRQETKQLCDLAVVRIGAVTGDGGYFLLNEQRRRALALPVDAMVPILSHASHLAAAEVTHADWKRLRDQGERVWLFRPPNALLRHPAVAEYLRLPMQSGGCNRTALQVRRRRDDWHRVKLPVSPDAFVSGMGRFGPWLSLRRDPRLTVTNTLYVMRFKRRMSLAEMSAWALMLLSEQAQTQVEVVLRQYPDGLVKVEPGDFTRLRLPVPRRISGALGAYREAVGHLLDGDRGSATAIAARFL